MSPRSTHAESSHVLLASGFGDAVSGGGLFALEGSAAQRIDRVSTKGLAFDGRRLARVLRCIPESAHLAELVVYDAHGVQKYLRLDEAPACHDIAWDGENVVAVSPWDNAVRWFSPGGEVVRQVRYPGPTDVWHINCLARRDGIWYATLFGAFRTFRAWVPQARSGEGRIVELDTGRTVVEGLTAPHSPRWVDGMWLVCNSQCDELLAFDGDSGRLLHRVPCEGWTRGLAYDDDFFYVGACRRRATAESFGHARIVVIDRRTWLPVEQIALPVQEIYDLTFVSREVLAGARRGFDVNPLRSAEFRQLRILSELGCEQPRTLWPSGDPLPRTEFRFSIAAELPATCSAGALIELPVRVSNRSASFFTNTAPAPVYVSYKWLDPRTGSYLDQRRAYRTWLPRTVFPNESVDVIARIIVPTCTGKARLRVTLVQEGVSWFDELDQSGAAEGDVEITAALPAPPDDAPMIT
jgi:Domain of unknown function (DUF4915)